ncbi:MAG: hypothetical protein WC700_19020 [Gemmatimonadaceae bacterium]|jgi:hypothetical protein
MTTDTHPAGDAAGLSPAGVPQIVQQVQLITRCGCTRVHVVTGDEMPDMINIRLHDYDGDGKPGKADTSSNDNGMYRTFKHKPSTMPVRWPVYVEVA